MSKIVITGVTGFIGRALCQHLLKKGHTTVGTSRTPDLKAIPADMPIYKLNYDDDSANWAKILSGADTVVHLAARAHVLKDTQLNSAEAYQKSNVDFTVRLAESALRAAVKRFIFISSIKVNGEATTTPFSESDPPAPEGAYSLSKFTAELKLTELTKNTAMELTILRIPLVYGPNVKGNFLSLLKICEKAWPLPLGRINNNRSLLYLGNFVSAVEATITHPGNSSGTYLISDGDDISTSDLIKEISNILNRPNRLFPLPLSILSLLAVCIGKTSAFDRLTGSLQLESTKFQQKFDWKPVFSLRHGLEDTARWFDGSRI